MVARVKSRGASGCSRDFRALPPQGHTSTWRCLTCLGLRGGGQTRTHLSRALTLRLPPHPRGPGSFLPGQTQVHRQTGAGMGLLHSRQGPRLNGRNDTPASLEEHHGFPFHLGFVSKIHQVLEVMALAWPGPPHAEQGAPPCVLDCRLAAQAWPYVPHQPQPQPHPVARGGVSCPRHPRSPARDSRQVLLWPQVCFCVGGPSRSAVATGRRL